MSDPDPRLQEIVVVSDESRDGTDEIVSGIASRGPRVPLRLLRHPVRRGKGAAINEILEACAGVPIVVLISADALPQADCLRRLVDAFDDESVGVAAARVIPVGPRANLAASLHALLFELHHQIAKRHPKSTEVTALRNLGFRISPRAITDEAEIEAAVTRAGLRVKYVPEARILSNSPLTLGEYRTQRRRVMIGHLRLAESHGYRVGTIGFKERVIAGLKCLARNPLKAPLLVFAGLLETRILAEARREVRRAKPGEAAAEHLWARSESTKREILGDRRSSR